MFTWSIDYIPCKARTVKSIQLTYEVCKQSGLSVLGIIRGKRQQYPLDQILWCKRLPTDTDLLEDLSAIYIPANFWSYRPVYDFLQMSGGIEQLKLTTGSLVGAVSSKGFFSPDVWTRVELDIFPDLIRFQASDGPGTLRTVADGTSVVAVWQPSEAEWLEVRLGLNPELEDDKVKSLWKFRDAEVRLETDEGSSVAKIVGGWTMHPPLVEVPIEPPPPPPPPRRDGAMDRYWALESAARIYHGTKHTQGSDDVLRTANHFLEWLRRE